jgi:ankyrin repeat protein
MNADIQGKMCNELSVMHCAAQTYTGSLSILVLCKLLSFDVNMRDNKEATALHFATMHKEAKNVELLIKFGADLNAKDFQGQTALHIAVLRLMKD